MWSRSKASNCCADFLLAAPCRQTTIFVKQYLYDFVWLHSSFANLVVEFGNSLLTKDSSLKSLTTLLMQLESTQSNRFSNSFGSYGRNVHSDRSVSIQSELNQFNWFMRWMTVISVDHYLPFAVRWTNFVPFARHNSPPWAAINLWCLLRRWLMHLAWCAHGRPEMPLLPAAIKLYHHCHPQCGIANSYRNCYSW